VRLDLTKPELRLILGCDETICSVLDAGPMMHPQHFLALFNLESRQEFHRRLARRKGYPSCIGNANAPIGECPASSTPTCAALSNETVGSRWRIGRPNSKARGLLCDRLQLVPVRPASPPAAPRWVRRLLAARRSPRTPQCQVFVTGKASPIRGRYEIRPRRDRTRARRQFRPSNWE
jgi:hypothetical protein